MRERKNVGAQRSKNVKNWKGKEAGVLKCLKTFGKKKKEETDSKRIKRFKKILRGLSWARRQATRNNA